MEVNDPGEVGVTLDHRGQVRVNPPIDLARRKMLLDEAEDRQRLNNIAEGTGL